MTFENLFSIGAGIRVAFGVIFALFMACFVVIIVEETFLGGRRRRTAQKNARERWLAEEDANAPTSDPAPQSSDTPRHQL
jgi:hypothetical protein